MSGPDPHQEATIAPVLNCAVCGEPIETAFTIPRYPLITSASAAGQSAPMLPLAAGACATCSHVQLTRRASQATLRCVYDGDYTSVVEKGVFASADAMALDAKAFLDSIPLSLKRGATVMEIGCFDGAFLSLFEGFRLVGCEPNPIAERAVLRGIDVRGGYFRPEDFAPASLDLVVMRHLIEHVPEPGRLLDECASLLTPDGFVFIETPRIEDTLRRRVIGNFYHQHLHYFSETSLTALLARRGFVVAARGAKGFRQFVLAARGPIRAEMRAPADVTASVIEEFGRYRDYLESLRNDLARWIAANDDRIAIYGASSTATGIVHIAGLPPERVAYAVDGDPRKLGFTLPGTGIRVHKPDQLLTDCVDTVVVASDFFADEISRTLRERFAGAVRRYMICHPRFTVSDILMSPHQVSR